MLQGTPLAFSWKMVREMASESSTSANSQGEQQAPAAVDVQVGLPVDAAVGEERHALGVGLQQVARSGHPASCVENA